MQAEEFTGRDENVVNRERIKGRETFSRLKYSFEEEIYRSSFSLPQEITEEVQKVQYDYVSTPKLFKH